MSFVRLKTTRLLATARTLLACLSMTLIGRQRWGSVDLHHPMMHRPDIAVAASIPIPRVATCLIFIIALIALPERDTAWSALGCPLLRSAGSTAATQPPPQIFDRARPIAPKRSEQFRWQRG